MELYLIRHTTPAVEPGICYGQTDLALADSFAVEAAPLQRWLAPIPHLKVYSSPLQRCTRLAHALGGQPVTTDPRLLEMDFGDWERQPWEAIGEAAITRWSRDLVHYRIPGGESLQQLNQRALDFLHALRDKPYAQVALVTHQGVIRCLLAHLLDMPLAHCTRLRVDYGRACHIRLQRHWQEVIFINGLPR